LFSSVRFEFDVAFKYIVNANWDELESYVEKFLNDVQGEDFHPHPGLMLSLYEARAYHLIHETKIDKELAYVMAKVEAIDTEDDLYVPWDYADRVKKLITYVQTRYAVFSYVFFFLENVVSKCMF
jgi:hypothetical protein